MAIGDILSIFSPPLPKNNNLSIKYQTKIKIFSDMQELRIFTPHIPYQSVCTNKISLSPRKWKIWDPGSSQLNMG